MKRNCFWLGLALCAGFVLTSCSDDDENELGGGAVVEMPDDQPAAKVIPEGFYMLNEGWFGHDDGSVNYFSNTSADIKYHLFKEANPEDKLGNTTCHAAMWGNHIFLVSKQGNRLVVTDKQFKKQAVIAEIGGDGRMFLGIDDKKAYISTTNGIAKLDLEGWKLAGAVAGVSGEVGNMCLAEGKVFAVSADKLYILDALTDQVLKTVDGTFSTVILGQDGTVWVATATGLQKYDADDLEAEDAEIPFPSGMELYDSWTAWNPNSLCTSLQKNVLYWITGEKSLWAVTLRQVVKYDVERHEFKTFEAIGKSENDVQLSYYGAGIRVNPMTGELVTMATQDGWGDNYKHNWVFKLDANGKNLLTYKVLGAPSNPQEGYFWYHTLPFFEDANQPQILLNQVKVKAGETTEIDLDEKVVDYDNIFASMMVELTPAEGNLAEVILDGDDLKVKAGAQAGVTACKLAVISNGVRVEKNIQIVVE